MEFLATSGKLSNDVHSRNLIEYLREREEELSLQDAVIYYNFPLFRDTDEMLYRSKVLLISKSHGLVLFGFPGISSGDRTEDIETADQELTQLFSIIFSKLIKSKILRKSPRDIKVPFLSVLVLNDTDISTIDSIEVENDYITAFNSLPNKIGEQKLSQSLSVQEWAELRSIIEGAKGIVRPKERNVSNQADDSKGVILKRLELEIANFDDNQRRAALTIVDGPQRIRGLAGSGKTVVLAMKVAHIHLDDPDAQILFTFWTKSLYDIIRKLITKFYRHFNDRDPDWDKIHIRHAWGGKNVNGVYYNACVENGVIPETINTVGKGGNVFGRICKKLIDSNKVRQEYDYILIDEAQDLPIDFFKLCYQLAQGPTFDRKIVWAYDDLQNIINVEVNSPEVMFGNSIEGIPLISLDRSPKPLNFSLNQDIVLHKCYRNPLEVLVIAHAIGFGIYSDTVVQMLENKEHWQDVGYLVETGNCLPMEQTVILRPKENSPLSISDSQSSDEIVMPRVFPDLIHEVYWVVNSIQEFVSQGLRPDDIMVISLDDYNARTYFQMIGFGLADIDILHNNVLSNPYSEPEFLVEDHVTLTTVYRAKGNEAAVVFIVGIDAIYPDRRSRQGRNKLFTAFTRAKAWLRVSGIGDCAQFFLDEIEVARINCPRMNFVYPDPEQVHTHQRGLLDRAARLKELASKTERDLEGLDLEPDEREAFMAALNPLKK